VRDPPQHHQDRAEHEEPDADYERRAEPEPRVAGLRVLGLGEVVAGASAAIESNRMFSLTIVSPTYHTIDSAPMRIVETCGVR
jgi:hypothetical protein